MKGSTDRILVTHVGSLPRPNDPIALYRDDAPDENLQPRLRSSIADIVRQHVAARIDIVNDGEFGKPLPFDPARHQHLTIAHRVPACHA
jgi:5-methyltetrahydropteroyltriglutamate--homocysteine methyltransferase